jgi:hypothetical protein
MSQIILEVNNNEDENRLLTLLQRLGFSYSTKKETSDFTIQLNPLNFYLTKQ